MTPDHVTLCGGRVIDGTGSDAQIADVVIAGETIASVGEGARGLRIDVGGLTLVPGLIDAHSHLGYVDIADHDGERNAIAVTAARIFQNCWHALDAGFTTCRDAGGVDGGLAGAIERGLIEGPRLFPSGPLLCQTAGHGDLDPPFAHRHGGGLPGLVHVSQVCDGPDQVRRAAREAFRHGATQIKVCVSGGVVSSNPHERLGHAQFTVDELRAAVEEAAARDTYVMAHAHSLRGIRNGLAAGVRSFEHATFLDEDTANALAERGAVVVPTLAVAQLMATRLRDWGVPESAVERIAGIEQAMGRAVQLALAAGVVVGSGSDLLGPRQDRRGLELLLKAKLIGPLAAIVSATQSNARILQVQDRLGTLAADKLADVVGYDGDPLEEPELFDDPARTVLVIKGGRVVKDSRGVFGDSHADALQGRSVVAVPVAREGATAPTEAS